MSGFIFSKKGKAGQKKKKEKEKSNYWYQNFLLKQMVRFGI